ncbi:MAG: selenide, water dikinase SelD, partial [Acidobacteria bacterium]|nr:selenide, water dikinase SelD [Acidobacteriota bacterium]
MSGIPHHPNARVLVDYRTADDAGVYEWEGGPALVQTVDFFTPIVDDPFTYGQIAAANALSDVYAMGGRPLTALAIAAFPPNEVSIDVIREVFAGGHGKLTEAGVALLGGHTIQDPEVKFGYAVTGSVDPRRMLSNAGARPGDVLILTKALGTGVIGTAIKFGRAPREVIEAAVDSMRTLNRAAAEAVATLPADAAHACTDVTGFGLVGHATAMAAASKVTMRFDVDRVPLLPGGRELVRRNRSGGLATNEDHYSKGVRLTRPIDPDVLALLYDPQTSGGLL